MDDGRSSSFAVIFGPTSRRFGPRLKGLSKEINHGLSYAEKSKKQLLAAGYGGTHLGQLKSLH